MDNEEIINNIVSIPCALWSKSLNEIIEFHLWNTYYGSIDNFLEDIYTSNKVASNLAHQFSLDAVLIGVQDIKEKQNVAYDLGELL